MQFAGRGGGWMLRHAWILVLVVNARACRETSLTPCGTALPRSTGVKTRSFRSVRSPGWTVAFEPRNGVNNRLALRNFYLSFGSVMWAHKITSGRNIMPQNCIEFLQKCELCLWNNHRLRNWKYVHVNWTILSYFESKSSRTNQSQTLLIPCTIETLISKNGKQWCPFSYLSVNV